MLKERVVTKMVLMPKELSEEVLQKLANWSYDLFSNNNREAGDASIKSFYEDLVSAASQPAPQQSWNDAIRTVLDAVNNIGGDACFQLCGVTYTEKLEAMNAVEALLDQQPEIPK